jgi:hypothetical protein
MWTAPLQTVGGEDGAGGGVTCEPLSPDVLSATTIEGAAGCADVAAIVAADAVEPNVNTVRRGAAVTPADAAARVTATCEAAEGEGGMGGVGTRFPCP